MSSIPIWKSAGQSNLRSMFTLQVHKQLFSIKSRQFCSNAYSYCAYFDIQAIPQINYQ